MACNAAVCRGHRILHPPGPNGHVSDPCETRSNGIEHMTRTMPESARLCIRIMKLLAVFLCRRNFLHSTRSMKMLAETLITKIRMYITRLKFRRWPLMASDSVGSGFVVETAIVNFNQLREKASNRSVKITYRVLHQIPRLCGKWLLLLSATYVNARTLTRPRASLKYRVAQMNAQQISR